MLGGLFEDASAYAIFKNRLMEIFKLNDEYVTKHDKPSLSVVKGAINYVCNALPILPND